MSGNKAEDKTGEKAPKKELDPNDLDPYLERGVPPKAITPTREPPPPEPKEGEKPPPPIKEPLISVRPGVGF